MDAVTPCGDALRITASAADYNQEFMPAPFTGTLPKVESMVILGKARFEQSNSV
jgi:hypothetical protein